MNFLINKAKIEDINEINNLLTDLIQDERAKYDNNINKNFQVKNFYNNYINNDDSCILVAKDNNIILGYVYGFIQNNGDLFNKNIAQLDALFVKEKYRGNGIGKSLINEFIKWAKEKKASFVDLSVCKNNDGAMKLYESEEFTVEKLYLRKKL